MFNKQNIQIKWCTLFIPLLYKINNDTFFRFKFRFTSYLLISPKTKIFFKRSKKDSLCMSIITEKNILERHLFKNFLNKNLFHDRFNLNL
jgi:hypothetical protein